LLCIAVELDPSIGLLCAAAQHDDRATHPTFALALTLFDEPSWDALAPLGALRYWRLIDITQPPGQPLTTSALRADERIVSYLKGLDYLDDRLEPLVVPIEPLDVPDPPTQHAAAEEVLRRWSVGGRAVQLVGADAGTKKLVAARAAAAAGRRLYVLAAEHLPSQAPENEELARLWHRESLLSPVALYLDAQEVDANAHDAGGGAIARFLTRCHGPACVGTREVWTALAENAPPVEVSGPTFDEQRAIWTELLPDMSDDALASELAAQFSLNLPMIHSIARYATTAPALLPTDVWDECVVATQPRMDALAQRIDAKATWDDLVLPKHELQLLRRIVAQVRNRSTVYQRWGFAARMNRGLGISVLFAGPSGTGKTMAAEVIANDLRLSLYRVDLSAVVSKYIGETEKNLRRLFDAAEVGGSLLLFDEADALFGKRSEVKDSHDRYANIEINYLLQRMEQYSGVAILATNMKTALDTAFMRRIRFILNVAAPAAAERRLIWQKAFPREVPLAAPDWDRLASLTVTGGMIHSIALNAAFAAADRGSPVSMEIILDAARAEFGKLELPVVDHQFRDNGRQPVPA
jgi:hypothetical protein